MLGIRKKIRTLKTQQSNIIRKLYFLAKTSVGVKISKKKFSKGPQPKNQPRVH